jgi:hypothetical protein
VEPEADNPLEALQRKLEDTAPQLYRHLALYLQVLREILPGRVDQVCFHLATQVDPPRYAALPAEHRLHLHQRIHSLVKRCLALLTVEQLSGLAAQMQRQHLRQVRLERSRLLTHLALDQRGAPEPATAAEPATAPGSVRLGLALPPVPRWHGVLLPGESPLEDAEASVEEPMAPLPEDEAAAAADADPPSPSLWQESRLPRDPEQRLRWLEGMDLALTRRLRNLSHAINVEWLRAGLSSSLLPVNLLDAVLSGQLETLTAPPNLLRLQIPFGVPQSSEPYEAMAILLRCADLEMEEPRLRTCRRRLEQHRGEVRTMAKDVRRLQRRLQKRRAETLWLQDIRRSRPDDN